MRFAGSSSEEAGAAPELVAVAFKIERDVWEEFRVAAKRRDMSRAGLARQLIRRTAVSARPGPYADPAYEAAERV